MRKKKFITGLQILFLALALAVLCPLGGKAYAASLSKKSICMWYQDSRLVTLKGAGSGVKWSSSNKNVATVVKSGSNSAYIYGKGVGSATITAKYGGKTYKCKVKTWSISLSTGTNIPIGYKAKFTIKGAKFSKLSVSNKSIAAISKKGTVKGKKKGSCYINYTVAGEKYRLKITVDKPQMEVLTWKYYPGGSWDYVRSGNIKPGSTGNITIKNSRAGVEQNLYFYFAGKNASKGLKITSSNPRVLSYYRIKGEYVICNSLEHGTTILTVKYKGYTYKFKVTITDSYNDEYKNIRKQIYSYAGITSSMSVQEKCLRLACWICDNVVYDHANADADTTAIGKDASYKDFMRSDLLVCAGYTDLYMYLCDGLGISCRQARNGSMKHEWNQVKIDGSWYNVDVCWMDSATDGKYSMQYFMVSDSKMKSASDGSHLSDPDVKATSTRYDGCYDKQTYKSYYYSYTNPWFTGDWKNY